MDQHNELIYSRQVFLSLFVREMRRCVSYELQFALFNLIYLVLPTLFVCVILPLRVAGVITPMQFVAVMIAEAMFSSFIYLRIAIADHRATLYCLQDIFCHQSWLPEQLRRSAKLQWAEE